MPMACEVCHKTEGVQEVADFRELKPEEGGEGQMGRRRRATHSIHVFCPAHNRPSKVYLWDEEAQEFVEGTTRKATAAERDEERSRLALESGREVPQPEEGLKTGEGGKARRKGGKS